MNFRLPAPCKTATLILAVMSTAINSGIAQTTITKWPMGKSAAISLTYDDGSINQFRQAMPIMDSLGFPGTFFIVTGAIPGSKYPSAFIGRPVKEIIEETKTQATGMNNFFERASAAGHLGYKGTLKYHFEAGTLFEQGKLDEAYRKIDEAYARVRAGEFPAGKDTSGEAMESGLNTWEEFRRYAKRGHEFGSHTISHARLAVLDEVNMLYELEKSREDIRTQLGDHHTFSAEGPFGTENERVMETAFQHKLFPALRNRMPHEYLEELNRGSKKAPGVSDKEYVQWQRGPLSATPMDLMRSWIDTLMAHDNIWLTLVFHGVSGIGWQAKPAEDLASFFRYIKQHEQHLWVATFGDATRYMRERMASTVSSQQNTDRITVKLDNTLDKKMYYLPLTLKTYLPENWTSISIRQGKKGLKHVIDSDQQGRYILYEARANNGLIEIRKK